MSVYHSSGTEQIDARDRAIVAERVAARDAIAGARVGDFVIFPDGTLARFSHDWGHGLQTSPGGSFYLGNGYLSFSGGLDRTIGRDTLIDTGEVRNGSAWVFHHDRHTAHNGIDVTIPCRVFSTTASAPIDWRTVSVG